MVSKSVCVGYNDTVTCVSLRCVADIRIGIKCSCVTNIF